MGGPLGPSIFYGYGDAIEWIGGAMIDELEGLPIWSRYLGTPPLPKKTMFERAGPLALHRIDSYTEKEIAHFVQAIRSSRSSYPCWGEGRTRN